MAGSLCQTCDHMREIQSGKGSLFLLCRLSQSDARYRKYPPQPVLRCDGHSQQSVKKNDDRQS